MKRYLLYIPLLILASLLLTGCTKKTDYDSSKIEFVGSEKKETEKKVDTPKSDDLGYLSNPEEFSKSKQSVGEISDGEYTIDGLEDSQESGYHLFLFKISSTSESPVPYVLVEPVLDRGVYRVSIKGVVKDNSNLGYQKSIEVDKGAITRIYRAVTSQEKTSIYEVGFLGSNLLKLEQEEVDSGVWNISVKVSYDFKYSPPTVDFGSTEFGSDIQKISGMQASDGARISSYSYSFSGGVLKFVFSVASGTSNPIPSVEAEYDSENILVVRFPSLESDKVSGWASTISLPAGIQASVSRVGKESVYKFGGIGGSKPFKLSASQSPNQVLVEIKTR
ncbi:MAG: hypothetical protein ACOX0X_00935 [Candidatus Dojkabacteria bacterium]|jgi:hypothetical protein